MVTCCQWNPECMCGFLLRFVSHGPQLFIPVHFPHKGPVIRKVSSGRHYQAWSPSQAIWRGSSEIRIPLGAPDNNLPTAKLSQFTFLQDTNETVIGKCWSYGSSIFCILKWGPYLSYGEVIWHIEGWTTWPNYCRRHLKKIFFVNKNICNSRIMFPTVELTTSQHCMVLISDFWPLLLTWFNFNPSMDK